MKAINPLSIEGTSQLTTTRVWGHTQLMTNVDSTSPPVVGIHRNPRPCGDTRQSFDDHVQITAGGRKVVASRRP